MATQRPQSLRDELATYNARLDRCLRLRYGMSLKTFKAIKAATQLVGAAAGIYAMSLEAPPLAALAMVTLMVTGPEAMEYFINNSSAD